MSKRFVTFVPSPSEASFLFVVVASLFFVALVAVLFCRLNRPKLPLLPTNFSFISAFDEFLAISRSFIIFSRADASPRTLAPMEALFCFAPPPHRASKASSLKIASSSRSVSRISRQKLPESITRAFAEDTAMRTALSLVTTYTFLPSFSSARSFVSRSMYPSASCPLPVNTTVTPSPISSARSFSLNPVLLLLLLLLLLLPLLFV